MGRPYKPHTQMHMRFDSDIYNRLKEYINAVNKERYSFDYSSYSIKQRIRIKAKDLLIFGYKLGEMDINYKRKMF